MAKMIMSMEERKDVFLYSTTIENFFINEMLPKAPGNYVKVFIFGCMYSQCQMEIDTTQMSHNLGLSEQELFDAWKYWESEGLVRIHGSGQFNQMHIEFIRQIDKLYGKGSDASQQPSPNSNDREADTGSAAKLVNEQLKNVLENFQEQSGRTISRRDAEIFKDALCVYGIAPDVLDFAIDYCASLGPEKCNTNYIITVARNWKESGCETVDQVRALMDEHELKSGIYKQIFREMGWSFRAPLPKEKEIIDNWLNVDGYTLKDILEACRSTAGVRNPSFQFVDNRLKKAAAKKGGIATFTAPVAVPSYQAPVEPAAKPAGDKPEAKVSRKVLSDYFEYIKEKGAQEHRERLEDARKNIPGMKALLDKEVAMNQEVIMLRGPERAKRKESLTAARGALEEEKKILLAEYGRPADYLVRKYKCDICRDTGYTDEGMVCRCCKERAEEAYKWYCERARQKEMG